MSGRSTRAVTRAASQTRTFPLALPDSAIVVQPYTTASRGGTKRRGSESTATSSKRGRTAASGRSRRTRQASAGPSGSGSGNADGNGRRSHDDGPPKKFVKRTTSKKIMEEILRLCPFCRDHPEGQRMARERPCNVEMVDGFVMECQNCADYRFSSADPDHKCLCSPDEQETQVFRRYATNQPVEFPEGSICTPCSHLPSSQRCDVDPYLQLQCTNCSGSNKKNCQSCYLKLPNSQNLGWDPETPKLMDDKPSLRKGKDKWFRHECDICSNHGAETSTVRPCSWLRTKENTAACERCTAGKMSCMASGILVAHPAVLDLPTAWTTSSKLDGGWVDLRGSPNVYRKQCASCAKQKRHCRVSAKHIDYACNWCWQTGMTCQDKDDPNRFYPLFNISRVGIGNFCPFSRCTRCEETGRNCDRQRPCDSCVHNNEDDKCDKWLKLGDDRTLNCLDGRVKPGRQPAGILYYLSLGYGPGGVNDVKDGTKIEHWVGPPFPRYAHLTVKQRPDQILPQNKMCIVSGVEAHRKDMMPRGAPPLGAPGYPLENVNVDSLTVDILRNMLESHMGADHPRLCNHPKYTMHRETEIESAAFRRGARQIEEVEDGDEDGGDGDGDNDVGAAGSGNNVGANADANLYGSQQFPNNGDFGQGNSAQGQQGQHGTNDSNGVPNMSMANTGAGNTLHNNNNNNDNDNQVAVLPPAIQTGLYRDHLAHRSFFDILLIVLNHPLLIPPESAEFSILSQIAVSHLARWALHHEDYTDLRSIVAEENSIVQDMPWDGYNGQGFGLFTVLSGTTFRATPISRLLNHIPLTPSTHPQLQQGINYCVDCRSRTNTSSCECTTHPHPTPVCHTCDQGSKNVVVNTPQMAITKEQLLNMRAYFCGSCQSNTSPNLSCLRPLFMLGANDVFGCRFDDTTETDGKLSFGQRTMAYHSHVLPITGCSCGTKIFHHRLCRDDRIKYARFLTFQSARVREWRAAKGEDGFCPSCLAQYGPEGSNFSPDTASLIDVPSTSLQDVSWACLVCGDLVLNQSARLPVIPGWHRWFDIPMASDWGVDLSAPPVAGPTGQVDPGIGQEFDDRFDDAFSLLPQ